MKTLDFNFRFNINRIAFVSQLNEELKKVMNKSEYPEEWMKVIVKDYTVQKRQFVFYLLECRRGSELFDVCNKRDVRRFQEDFNRLY